MKFGHDSLDSTEVYSYKDDAWTWAGKLRSRMEDRTAVTINNRVLLFGKYEHLKTDKLIYSFTGKYGEILEYDPESKKWIHILDLWRDLTSAGVSVVDFTDYVDFCQ